MEANFGCWIHLDCDFGESCADSATCGLVAPDACMGSGADVKRNVSELHSRPVLQTCYYQRKDSPVGAFRLSPEPLESDGEKRKEEMGRQREAPKHKGNMRKSEENIKKEEK